MSIVNKQTNIFHVVVSHVVALPWTSMYNLPFSPREVEGGGSSCMLVNGCCQGTVSLDNLTKVKNTTLTVISVLFSAAETMQQLCLLSWR